MIHPATQVQLINPEIGYGVFARAFIPAGTIVYVKDALEIEIKEGDPRLFIQHYKDEIEKYSYIDPDGTRIISWDIAKYVNHSCDHTTISTGYGFEVATRDIMPGEQITDEYGIFNLDYSMPCACGSANCRKNIHPEDFDRLYPVWDAEIKEVIRHFNKVEQPLAPFVDNNTMKQLQEYLSTGKNYKSVYELRYRREPVMAHKH